jgi:hypothetical protein
METLPMEPGRLHSTAAPDDPPVADSARPAEHPYTCGLFPVLVICEKAHRDRTGRPLCLGSPDFPAAALAHHLDVEGCPVCRRWYANAFQ